MPHLPDPHGSREPGGSDPVVGTNTGLVALPPRGAAQELRLLLQFAEMLGETTDQFGVTRAVAQVSVGYLGATFGGVAVIDEGGINMRFLDLSSLPETVRSRQTFPLSSNRPAAVATRERRALWIESCDASAVLDDEAKQAMRAIDVAAAVYLPLSAGAQAVGCLVLLWSQPMRFDDADRRLLYALGGYAGQALLRARLAEERESTARVLQAALLPALPSADWLDLHAYYRPANAANEVGGDWYDAFNTGGQGERRSMTVVVGDVHGHDTQAAAQMGRMQSKLHALAYDNLTPPGHLLSRLDRVMNASLATTRLASAVVATIRPSGRDAVTVSWTNAGHPPPLYIAPDGSVRLLDSEPELPLGLQNPVERTTHETELPFGGTLLLYTDGLIERRRVPIDDGLDALCRAAENAATTGSRLAQFVDSVLAELADTLVADDPGDDIAVLAVRPGGAASG